MAEFKPALDFVLAAEGSEFVDDPADSGGATKAGISLRFLRSLPADRLKRYGIFGAPQSADVRDLSPEQIALIYEWEFWIASPFEDITQQDIASYIFSMAVLHGQCQAAKIAQRATWAVMERYEHIADDGVIGKQTCLLLNSLCQNNHDALRTALMAEHAGYCRLIASQRKKDERFLHGWLQRCYQLP